jgi:type III secretory pathway lipoprotein EscJ
MDQERAGRGVWLCIAAACWLLPACEREAPREVIATATTQREAIEIAAALEQRDVPAVRVEERRSGGREQHAVTAPTSAAAASRQTLAELGLPRPTREGSSDEPSVFPTRADETARERRRRAAALERSLELLDGVTVASVVVAEAQGEATGRAAPRPTLLVTLRSAGLAGTPAEAPLRDRTMLAVRATFPEVNPATDATIIVAGTAAERVEATTAMKAMATSTTPRDERTSGLTPLDRTLMAFTVATMLTLAWLQWRSLRRATEGRA